MNIENMRLWVARLRDPEARQTQCTLRSHDGAMCCLGHACDVSQLGDWSGYAFYNVNNQEYGGYLPKPVAEWLDIDELNPIVQGVSLSQWNDSHGKTLPEIADLLEEKYPEIKI